MNLPWLASVVRFTLLSGYLLAMGDLTFAAFPERPSVSTKPYRLGTLLVGLSLMVLASLLEFGVLVWNMADGAWTQVGGDWLSGLFSTPRSTGTLLLIRVSAGLLVAAAALLLRRRFPGILLLLGGAGLTFLVSVDGHAGDEGWLAAPLAIDAVHALAAAVWLGGLAILWWRLPRLDEEDALGKCQGFSRLATVCFPLAVISGVVNGWYHLKPDLTALWRQPYGELLLAKTALVLVVLGLAFHLRQILLPAWASDAGASCRMRNRMGLELVFGMGILALTAILTQTSTTPMG